MEVEHREVLEEQEVIDQDSTETTNSGPVVQSDDIKVDGDRCVICWENAHISDPNCMKPCVCKGTMALVHTECIETWLTFSGRRSCGVCKFKYVIKTESQYVNTAKAMFAWMKSLSRDEVLRFSRNGVAALALVVTSVLIWSLTGFVVAKRLCSFYTLSKIFWYAGQIRNYGFLSRSEFFRSFPIGPLVCGIIFTIILKDFSASWDDWSSRNNMPLVKMVRMPPTEPEPQEQLGAE